MKHTKGPWEIRGQDIIGNEKNGYICTWSGREEDAHLIAAAPDMYEVLEELVMLWMEDMTCNTNRAKAALAKARGES